MTKPFIIKRDATGEIRVYLVDQDGNTLGWSESYKRYRSAVRCVELICDVDKNTSNILAEKDTDNSPRYYLRLSANNSRKLLTSVSKKTWEEADQMEFEIAHVQMAYNASGNDVEAMIDNQVTRKTTRACTQ